MASIIERSTRKFKSADADNLHVIEASVDKEKQQISMLNAKGLDEGTPIQLQTGMTIEDLDALIQNLAAIREEAKSDLGKADTLSVTIA